MELNNKRGIFFSTDALIAVSVIVIVLLIIIPLSEYKKPSIEIHRDLLKSFSVLKIGETNNSYIQSLIAEGKITDLNKSILEQIGEFYVTNITLAKNLTQTLLDDLNTSVNIGIWYQNRLIAAKNFSPLETAENIETARQIISGLCEGGSLTGYSARAFLTSKNQNKYYYFGGYVGDGNISIKIDIPGNATAGQMEIAINDDFEFYINNISQGTYSKSESETKPANYTIPTTNIRNGENIFEFRGDKLHIAGGFIKISYDIENFSSNHKTYHFPGINGLINIYDGFYIPSNITSMDILLHLKTNYTAFLTIGNITLFKNYTNDEETISIPDSELSTLLNYEEISKKTIPLRLGLENVSFIGPILYADVFSVTDISGSMLGDKIIKAKAADREFINYVLNYSGNRVGLTAYDTIARDGNFHPLSENNNTLIEEVNSWNAGGWTCICCGINKAIDNIYAHRSDLEDYLIAYLKMENDVLDSTENGNNGTPIGTPTYIHGVNGSAIRLDQTTYISLPTINITDEGAISFWVNLSTTQSQTLFDASTSNRFFFIDIDSARNLRFRVSDAEGYIYTISYYVDTTQTNRTYHHIAAVWRFYSGPPSLELYYDGRRVKYTNSIPHGRPSFLNPFIGRTRSNSGTTSTFTGAIDEFRIYSRALNSTEIIALNRTSPTCGNNLIEVGELCDSQQKICNLEEGATGLKQCNSQCSNWDSCIMTQTCGDGAKNSTEECDDGNTFNNDDCSSDCKMQRRLKSMVVMSDGQANVQCSRQSTGNAKRDAIQAACNAYDIYNITVYSVGFGSDADQTTLQAMANCGHGEYSFANIEDIVEIYKTIAAQIINAIYQEQTINATENVNTILYPDSKITFNFEEQPAPYGSIITIEQLFTDNRSAFFSLPKDSSILETVVISYSGPKWTYNIEINNKSIYNISKYGQDFITIGDPYQINIPNSEIGEQNNITLLVGVSPTEYTEGSASNKVIYTILKEASSYSTIAPKIDGCNWTIQFEDDSFISVPTPLTYTGPELCNYTAPSPIYDENDAVENAVYNLLKILDLDNDNKVDTKFTEKNLQIEIVEIAGLPFTWSTEVQIRTWY